MDQDRAIEISVKQSFIDPPILIGTDNASKTSRPILDPNPQLKDIDLGQASVYKWNDKNGHDWVGGLFKPSDFMPGRRYPLVVQTHGFTQRYFFPDGMYPTANAARELAAPEVLVLQLPDCPTLGQIEAAFCTLS